MRLVICRWVTNVSLEDISKVRPFHMIVIKFRDEAIIMGLGPIIEGDILIFYNMLNRLAFNVYCRGLQYVSITHDKR